MTRGALSHAWVLALSLRQARCSLSQWRGAHQSFFLEPDTVRGTLCEELAFSLWGLALSVRRDG